ncbi:hypothetical protein H6G89_18835 [Oscillatoria sp. FACHB-1407]|uniref:hypothetical protein n=1 Tax=Oscillatoria sp. FACHB-1407 TaxID=2692847 RepID=UPI00168216E3|nr:hypothetical protein [Oscillatoria sp. FACHB-1407]MBD2463095.1 hypothetical protein [Oscillatoria sp. FACHB-1407]
MISLSTSAILLFSLACGGVAIATLFLTHLCLAQFSFGDFTGVVAIGLFIIR